MSSKVATLFLFVLLSVSTLQVAAERPFARALRMKRSGSLDLRSLKRDVPDEHPGPHAPPHDPPPPSGPGSYKVKEMFEGKSFFEGWDFFDKPDPTHGTVNYLNRDEAMGKGLAVITEEGQAMIKVDDVNDLPEGTPRDSVRLVSKKKYNGGLFVADFAAVPVGCSVWPAWWTVGPEWPKGGEIDILEGVNKQDVNQYTLHTAGNCQAKVDAPMEGKIEPDKLSCVVGGDKGNAGCGIKDSDPRSFGYGFNQAKGGVFAHTWDKEGIKIWHFARDEIPADLHAKNPNPATWPKPAAFFPAETCSPDHFYEHSLVINITLCGDWAGNDNVFKKTGCAGSCRQLISKAANYHDAKFKINYVAVYEKV